MSSNVARHYPVAFNAVLDAVCAFNASNPGKFLVFRPPLCRDGTLFTLAFCNSWKQGNSWKQSIDVDIRNGLQECEKKLLDFIDAL